MSALEYDVEVEYHDRVTDQHPAWADSAGPPVPSTDWPLWRGLLYNFNCPGPAGKPRAGEVSSAVSPVEAQGPEDGS